MASAVAWALSSTKGLFLDTRANLKFKEKKSKRKKKPATLEDRKLIAPEDLKDVPLSRDVPRSPLVHCKRFPMENHTTKLASATFPVDVWFSVPADNRAKGCRDKERMVCISGPHGPLWVPLPAGALTMDRVRHRIGPAATYMVEVPDGVVSGDLIPLKLSDGETVQVPVPEGKCPGDSFEVGPPVIMVQVPEGLKALDIVSFRNPGDLKEMRCAQVPQSVEPGQYFAVPLEPQGPDGDCNEPGEEGDCEPL